MTYANNAFEQMKTAKLELILEQPLMGNIAMHYQLKDASDFIETISFDGHTVLFNPQFISGLSINETKFSIIHSLLCFIYGNLLFDDFSTLINQLLSQSKIRKDSRIKEINYKTILRNKKPLFYNKTLDAFNKSLNYFVNCELNTLGIKEMPTQGVYDWELKNLPFNDVFFKLLERPKKRFAGKILTQPFYRKNKKDCFHHYVYDTIVSKDAIDRLKEILKFSYEQAKTTQLARTPTSLLQIINNLDIDCTHYSQKINCFSKSNIFDILNGTIKNFEFDDQFYIRQQQILSNLCIEQLKTIQDDCRCLEKEGKNYEKQENTLYLYIENFIKFTNINFAMDMFIFATILNMVRQNNIQAHPQKVSTEAFDIVREAFEKVDSNENIIF